jgi:hypothetical protein
MSVFRPPPRTKKCWPWKHEWRVFTWNDGFPFEYGERYCEKCGLCHVKGQTTEGKWRDPDDWY